MKTLNKYQCEYCNSIYSTEERCMECESNHKKQYEIIDVAYPPANSKNLGRPDAILIHFKEDKDDIGVMYEISKTVNIKEREDVEQAD